MKFIELFPLRVPRMKKLSQGLREQGLYGKDRGQGRETAKSDEGSGVEQRGMDQWGTNKFA